MSNQIRTINVKYPAKFKGWDDPCRYKAAYGGRGSGKTWQIARKLLIMSIERNVLIFCAREIQKSIEDSVKSVLESQADLLGIKHYFEIQNTKIIAKQTGSVFKFVGLRHNVGNIKGIEGADVVWIDEASSISSNSWHVLKPTIRKDGSEIWVTFNPELEDDVVYQEFVVTKPENSFVIEMNYNDNPWFPQVLQDELKALEESHPQLARHIYGGELLTSVSDPIFTDSQIGYYDTIPLFQKVGIYGDTAQSTSDKAAYSVFILVGKLNNDLYVLDVVRERLDADDLLTEGQAFWKRHGGGNQINPAPPNMKIEDKSSGIGLNQQLQKRGVPIDPIKRSKNQSGKDQVGWGEKWERAQRASMKLKSLDGKIKLPLKATSYSDGLWVSPFKKEILAAAIRGDSIGFWDQIDPLSDSINDLFNQTNSIYDSGF